MTVENQNSKSGPYALDGGTLRFPRQFYVQEAGQLRVFRVLNGVETEITTGFTQTGIREEEGEVVFTEATYPAGGGDLVLKRDIPITQETDYSNQARVRPEQVEEDLDNIVRMIQDIKEVLGRGFRLSIDRTPTEAELEEMTRSAMALSDVIDEVNVVAGNIDAVNAVSDGMDAVQVVSTGIDAIKDFSGSVLSFHDKSFEATSGQYLFDVGVHIYAPENAFVWRNKVRLVPHEQYSTEGNIVQLTTPVSGSDIIDVLVVSAVSSNDVFAARDDAVQAADDAEGAADRAEDAADEISNTIKVVSLVFDGTQSSFALGVDIPSGADIFVTVNGVLQSTSAYTVSAQTITFLEAPPIGTGEARIIGKMVRRNGGLLPGPITALTPPWGWSSSMRHEAEEARISTDLNASDGEIKPAFAVEYTLNGDASVGLDFPGASGGSVMPGLYVQHKQVGSNPANNAFSHSIAAYALNDAMGDNDVIGVSGRATKRNVTNGVGDAAGVWGSAYQFSQQRGLVMAAEATVYQNVAGSAPRDRLNTHLLPGAVSLHLGSYSTGSPALAIIAADGSGQGAWNYEIIDGNLWSSNKGASGTVGINCGSWTTGIGYPDIGWKVGEANWHIYRDNALVKIGTNSLDVENPSGGASGIRVRGEAGEGNAYFDLMSGEAFKGSLFWDHKGDRVVLSTTGAVPLDLRSNATTRMRIDGAGNIILNAISSKNYANDSAAGSAGVPTGGMYHTDGVLKIRRT